MGRTRFAGTALVLVFALVLFGCGLINQPPNAEFVVGYNPDLVDPLWVTFDARGSLDPDGDAITAYLWVFGLAEGGPGVVFPQEGYMTRLVTDPVITVHYPLQGTYRVTLAVRDEHGAMSLTVFHDITLPHVPVAPTD